MTGTIARIVADRGFGFITPGDGGDDVFFHARGLSGVEFDDLKEGDAVTFDVENGPKGPAAANVARADGAAPASDDAASDDASDEAPAEEPAA